MPEEPGFSWKLHEIVHHPPELLSSEPIKYANGLPLCLDQFELSRVIHARQHPALGSPSHILTL